MIIEARDFYVRSSFFNLFDIFEYVFYVGKGPCEKMVIIQSYVYRSDIIKQGVFFNVGVSGLIINEKRPPSYDSYNYRQRAIRDPSLVTAHLEQGLKMTLKFS